MYQIKKQFVFISLAAASLILTGCSSSPAPEQSAAHAELQAELAEWKKMKPGVQRLVAIESELKVLLNTLETAAMDPTDQLQSADVGQNVQSYVLEPVSFNDKKLTPEVKAAVPAQLPAVVNTTQTAEPQPATLASAPEKKAEALIAPAAQPLQNRSFSLQLASVTEQQALESTWQRLQQRYPDQLSDLDFHSEEVIVSNRTYFRVKAGSFDSYDEAKRQCTELRKSGASCIVNKG
jgi:hypothetical protein